MKKNKWENKSIIDPAEEGVISFIPSGIDSYLIPKRGSELLPEWYKKLPAKTKLRSTDPVEDLTIKRCIPVLDAFTTGYFLVTDQDYYFSKGEDGETYMFSGEKMFAEDGSGAKRITMHPMSQVGDMPISPEFIPYAFKWSSPWVIKTPPGFSCIYTHPFNHHDFPFYSLTGVVDTDTYFQPVLFPFMMKNNFEGKIPAGTPVIQIIPFARNDWKMEVLDKVPHSLLSDLFDESRSYESGRYDADGEAFGGMYKKFFRKKKRYI